MSTELNCRGLACPGPVLQLKEIFEKGTPAAVSTIVDNEAAKENIIRFLEHRNFLVTVEKFGVDFRVSGTTQEGTCEIMEAAKSETDPGKKKILVMVGTDRVGHGDDNLGAGLMLNFLKTLKEMGPDLWSLVFVNNGVKLTVTGSEAVPILQGLAEEGIRILVCGTCLTHFQLLDQKQVGETTNMLDIVTGMQLADSVINI